MIENIKINQKVNIFWLFYINWSFSISFQKKLIDFDLFNIIGICFNRFCHDELKSGFKFGLKKSIKRWLNISRFGDLDQLNCLSLGCMCECRCGCICGCERDMTCLNGHTLAKDKERKSIKNDIFLSEKKHISLYLQGLPEQFGQMASVSLNKFLYKVYLSSWGRLV